MKHVALAALLVLAAVAGCTPEPTPGGEHAGSEEEALRQCLGRERVRGVDVSYYQGRIDWPAASAHGVAFAFARVADGAGFVDPAFADNWAGMKAAGVIRGSYQFFRPAQDPLEQAAVFLQELEARGGLRAGDLPPALDLETTDEVPAAAVRARAQAWLTRVEAAVGRTPIVYTSPGFWDEVGGSAAFGRYTLWLAHWETACPALPGAWARWRFWQDATSGAVTGIPEAVDTDWFDGSRAELLAFAGAPPPAPRGRDPRPAPRAKAPAKPRHKRRQAAPAADLARLLRLLPI